MPEPTTFELPHARWSAVCVGPLLALTLTLVFAAGALAYGESPSAGQRSNPVTSPHETPLGIAGEQSAAAVPRPAVASAAPAQGTPATPSAHDEALRPFLLLLLAIFALRPIVVLASAVLRRRRERLD
jgi:hypothetical protein